MEAYTIAGIVVLVGLTVVVPNVISGLYARKVINRLFKFYPVQWNELCSIYTYFRPGTPVLLFASNVKKAAKKDKDKQLLHNLFWANFWMVIFLGILTLYVGTFVAFFVIGRL